MNKILVEEYSYDPRDNSRSSSEEEDVQKAAKDLGVVSEKAEEPEKSEEKPENKSEEKIEEKAEEQVSNGEENKTEEQTGGEEDKPNRLSDRTKIEIIKETLAANQEQAEINHKAENNSSDGSNSSKNSKEKVKEKP